MNRYNTHPKIPMINITNIGLNLNFRKNNIAVINNSTYIIFMLLTTFPSDELFQIPRSIKFNPAAAISATTAGLMQKSIS